MTNWTMTQRDFKALDNAIGELECALNPRSRQIARAARKVLDNIPLETRAKKL